MLDALAGLVLDRPPVWLMRQAGRYLPEYRTTREQAGGFLDLCFNPKLAAEVTLQPIRRFGFDAAILFSDILVVPYALGQNVRFEAGEGPKLEPIENGAALSRLKEELDQEILAPVYETVARVRTELPENVALLGFCGAPWTVATYMIAGQGTEDQRPARLFAYREPEIFAELVDRLVRCSIVYLCRQLQAGADAVQLFDTWAGALPPGEFDRWCLEPAQRIVAGVRASYPTAKIIAFPRGAGTALKRYVETVRPDGIGLDWMIDRNFARESVPTKMAIQGNLDPIVLLAGGAALDRDVDTVLAAFAGRPFIFNLGHGILPETPVAHVEQMLRRVRGG